MANSKGKDWEGIVRSTLEQAVGVSVDRAPDPQWGYRGIQNICDFYVYRYPYNFYVECKTVKGNTLPFVNISGNQWQGMLDKSRIRGCLGIVVIWFSEWDRIAAVTIEYLEKRRQEGAKSFNIKELDDIQRGVRDVPCRVPRTNPKIQPEDLIDSFVGFMEE